MQCAARNLSELAWCVRRTRTRSRAPAFTPNHPYPRVHNQPTHRLYVSWGPRIYHSRAMAGDSAGPAAITGDIVSELPAKVLRSACTSELSVPMSACHRGAVLWMACRRIRRVGGGGRGGGAGKLFC